MVPAMTDATRQAASRQARQKAGGKLVQVMLTPKASDNLTAWQARGDTVSGVINRLIERSRP